MSKKNELVLKTYELLKTTGPYNIKIRTIATACNCTSTVIYRHFDDLDHLIRFASVRFLENYIVEIQRITNEKTDALEMLRTFLGKIQRESGGYDLRILSDVPG